jgi:hypothetical protein
MLYRITYLTRRKIFKYQENKLKSQTFVVMIDFYQTQISCGYFFRCHVLPNYSPIVVIHS